MPIFEAGELICIGIPDTDNYLELQKNENTLISLEKIIENGIEEKEIIGVAKLLFEKRLLTTKNQITNSRSQLFFDYLGLPIDYTILEKKLLIFGAGAGGATLCYLLAQFGFKNITIVDDDIVLQSDIEKTLVYNNTDINSKKIYALKKAINNNFNICIKTFDLKVTTSKDLSYILKMQTPDFVIKAFDPDLNIRYELNRLLFENNISSIHMSYSFDVLNIGPLFVPGRTCCDFSLNSYAIERYGENHAFEKNKRLFSNYTIHPSISFNINILCNMVFNDILFYFSGHYDFCKSLGKLFLFNPTKMLGRTHILECKKKCKFSNLK